MSHARIWHLGRTTQPSDRNRAAGCGKGLRRLRRLRRRGRGSSGTKQSGLGCLANPSSLLSPVLRAWPVKLLVLYVPRLARISHTRLLLCLLQSPNRYARIVRFVLLSPIRSFYSRSVSRCVLCSASKTSCTRSAHNGGLFGPSALRSLVHIS